MILYIFSHLLFTNNGFSDAIERGAHFWNISEAIWVHLLNSVGEGLNFFLSFKH